MKTIKTLLLSGNNIALYLTAPAGLYMVKVMVEMDETVFKLMKK